MAPENWHPTLCSVFQPGPSPQTVGYYFNYSHFHFLMPLNPKDPKAGEASKLQQPSGHVQTQLMLHSPAPSPAPISSPPAPSSLASVCQAQKGLSSSLPGRYNWPPVIQARHVCFLLILHIKLLHPSPPSSCHCSSPALGNLDHSRSKSCSSTSSCPFKTTFH